MNNDNTTILVGGTPLHNESADPEGTYVNLLGETYYRIANYDRMRPFLMSLVSGSDHWSFVASTGGLTAGRVDADSALFPYETEDKIAAHSELAGGKTIIRASRRGQTFLWEPFSDRYGTVYRRERHLYKNVYGNKIVFEEINHDLQLTMRVGWFVGDRFGFIRHCWLLNDSDEPCQVDLLDGLQNILPAGATSTLQNTLSSLLNAYKRNELESDTGIGLFALSATLSDRAEPSESLMTTVAWQVGLDEVCHLLGTDQLDSFRLGHNLVPEWDVRGKPGAYFVSTSFKLASGSPRQWYIVADVNQNSAEVARLEHLLLDGKEDVENLLAEDIAQGTANLIRFVAAADGLQLAAQETTTAHHFANVLFNVMRGGIFYDGYQIERSDVVAFVGVRNRGVLGTHDRWFAELPEELSIHELYARASDTSDPDLIRLCYEYLPLTFSRRHGDPSRPWNKFSINLWNPDGSPRLDYQGNWRDIFQNWEALTFSFPRYVEGMIAKFLNATTADGYNPYRVTRDGIEWESPEPHNPWSNIGYWSDHQIIYLQKLLQIAEQFHPGSLSKLWNRSIFSYANVPYRLRPYSEMLADWHDTIEFDWEAEETTLRALDSVGTDARLLGGLRASVVHATMTEKLLVLLLAKLTNLVPEGGIWMNTQRPEWNDANNALAGKGLSIVTTAYLNRFIGFWSERLREVNEEPFRVNSAVAGLFDEVRATLNAYVADLETGFTSRRRRSIMDDLGLAATSYRATVYRDGLPATQVSLSQKALLEFLEMAQAFIKQTLRANKRPDGLFHSYNVLRLGENEATVENLYLMLEGQVAMLSADMLAPEEALAAVRSLRDSDLYRADQNTYMLYPNRELPGFRRKNNITAARVAESGLVAALTAAGDERLLMRDDAGIYHFNGCFRNAGDVAAVLNSLADEPAYGNLVASERDFVLGLFEEAFNHQAFTGRSGTFFAYEGLGSVYWHMVSKLLLAVQECYQKAVTEGADKDVIDGLARSYYEVRAGLGSNKTPAEFGAFPTDPYSHTPMGGGARQPGMTGQVKEEILTRLGELGVSVDHGTLRFSPTLLKHEEFLDEARDFHYIDSGGSRRTASLPPGALAFTFCQTPIVYVRGEQARIDVSLSTGQTTTQTGNVLDAGLAQHIFNRDGFVESLTVTVPASFGIGS